MNEKVFITVTGTGHYLGDVFLSRGDRILLVKEPENRYDREAIRAEIKGLGKIGYVANSVHTVLGESFSAGRLYDRIGTTAVAKVKYILDRGVVCAVRKKDLLGNPSCSAVPGAFSRETAVPASEPIEE